MSCGEKGTRVRQCFIRDQGAAGVMIDVWSENILKIPKKRVLVLMLLAVNWDIKERKKR